MPCNYDLSNSQYTLMQMFWNNDREYTLAEAIDYYQKFVDEKKVSPNTIQTLLTRMVKKNVLNARKVGHKLYYRRSMTQAEYAKLWMDSFINEMFDGSLRSMMLTISGGIPTLTQEQKNELEDFWNE